MKRRKACWYDKGAKTEIDFQAKDLRNFRPPGHPKRGLQKERQARWIWPSFEQDFDSIPHLKLKLKADYEVFCTKPNERWRPRQILQELKIPGGDRVEDQKAEYFLC